MIYWPIITITITILCINNFLAMELENWGIAPISVICGFFFIIAVVYIIRNMFRLCRDCRRRKQSTRSCTILLNSLVKYVSRMKLTNHFLKNALKAAYRIKKFALLYHFSSFLQEFRSMPPIQKTCLCLAIKTNAL